ncbi:MAG: hypothetical protein KAS12_00975 [Candidatus Aenigmarchaeota archaeon]|nr:hypothetical protein [Candidatus Aenigmarchaeota archaeon]
MRPRKLINFIEQEKIRQSLTISIGATQQRKAANRSCLVSS